MTKMEVQKNWPRQLINWSQSEMSELVVLGETTVVFPNFLDGYSCFPSEYYSPVRESKYFLMMEYWKIGGVVE